MQKFKNRRRKIIISVVGLLIIGAVIVNNICLKSNNPEIKIQDKNLIAMYIQNTNGDYELSNTKKFPNEGYLLNTEKSNCKNDGNLTQNMESKAISLSTSNKEECTLYFDKTINRVLNHLNIKTKEENPDFSVASTTDETRDGLYAMDDNYGKSYYYRGAVENNYVRFGTNANGQDMWWRIVRFNGDGSMRIVYDGTQAWGNVSSIERYAITGQNYNARSDDNKYIGYMYGGALGEASTSYEQATKNETSSSIKIKIDEWYNQNIKNTGYEKYLQDNIFCNDRSIHSGNGYGQHNTVYNVYERIVNNSSPTFICQNKNDSFTVEDTIKGNGALTYPVGLLTTDEALAAGNGIYNTMNSNYYLYVSESKWTISMTPGVYANGAYILDINGWADIGAGVSHIDSSGGNASPVINIAPEYVLNMQGSGTMSDPYHLA